MLCEVEEEMRAVVDLVISCIIASLPDKISQECLGWTVPPQAPLLTSGRSAKQGFIDLHVRVGGSGTSLLRGTGAPQADLRRPSYVLHT